MSPVVRHKLPPSAGAHSHTASHPYWHVVGRLLLHHVLTKAAQVVLQIIDAPVGVHLGVLLFVPQRSRIARARLVSRARVDADLQPLRVHIIRKRLHVGKLLVRMQQAVLVALAFPRVVDVHVDVPCVLHAAGDNLIRGIANVLVRYLSEEVVPAVPPHRRRGSHLRWGQLRRRRGLCESCVWRYDCEWCESENCECNRGGKTHDGVLLKTISASHLTLPARRFATVACASSLRSAQFRCL